MQPNFLFCLTKSKDIKTNLITYLITKLWLNNYIQSQSQASQALGSGSDHLIIALIH